MKIDDEIEVLVEMLLRMAQVVEENLKNAFAFYKGEIESCKIDDDIVDHMEREIEEKCLDIMLKERPFAKDMRELSGILTLVSDIERLGDHAEDIYNLSLRLHKLDNFNIQSVDVMFEKAMTMVHKSITSFINKDEVLASKVIDADDEIDTLYLDEIDKIIAADTKNEMNSDLAILTTLVIKYIERIADHSVNIAEWVIFLIRGFYKDTQIF